MRKEYRKVKKAANMKFEKNKRLAGARYEETAAQYLSEEGYLILNRNYRNRYGEIDIVAKKEAVYIIVEVKYRGSCRCGDALEAVDKRKQRRICRTAMHYYREHGYGMDTPCRFDVIGIYEDGSISHIEDAFEFQW